MIHGANNVVISSKRLGLDKLLNTCFPEYSHKIRNFELSDTVPHDYFPRRDHALSRLSQRKDIRPILRDRFMYMLDVIGNNLRDDSRKIIDIGCNTGIFSNSLSRLGYHVTGIDINRKHLDIANQNKPKDEHIDFKYGDATHLFHHDNSFDSANITEVLEHVPDYMKVLNEAMRVVTPDGRIYVSVPRDNLIYDPGHINIFSKESVEKIIKGLGSKVEWHDDPKFSNYLIFSFKNKKGKK